MFFQYIECYLHTVPGNSPKIFDEPSTNIIFDEIEGDRFQPDFFQQLHPARSGWIMEHRNQACPRSHACHCAIPRVPQHEHDIFLKSLFQRSEMNAWGMRQVITFLVPHPGAVSMLQGNLKSMMVQLLDKLRKKISFLARLKVHSWEADG